MSSTLGAASTASSSSSSPRCVPFAFRRGGARGRLPAPAAAAAAGAAGCCGRPLCRPADVIQNAFFVSLDVCSCVEVRTNSFKESESDTTRLMPPPPHDDSRSATRRRASAAGKPRRGLGCCTPSSTY